MGFLSSLLGFGVPRYWSVDTRLSTTTLPASVCSSFVIQYLDRLSNWCAYGWIWGGRWKPVPRSYPAGNKNKQTNVICSPSLYTWCPHQWLVGAYWSFLGHMKSPLRCSESWFLLVVNRYPSLRGAPVWVASSRSSGREQPILVECLMEYHQNFCTTSSLLQD